MKIINFKVGPVHTNCYIVYDENTKKAVVIDPGESAGLILENLKEKDLELKYILLTHTHFDHIIAASKIQQETQAELAVHKKEIYALDKKWVDGHYGRYIKGDYAEPRVDIIAKDGTQVEFGGLKAKFIHTPGHTKGSSVIQIDKSLFTGDTLFAGECGRCDLDGGDFSEMLQSLKKLAQIEGNFDVYPGHEGFSTLDDERKSNRYMLQAMGN